MDRCPQDGGFIGDAGCTHPNHAHSPFVTDLLANAPREISPDECSKLLEEGVYVQSSENIRVGFGKSLLQHLEKHHNNKDAEERKRNILFAIDTVKNTKPCSHNEKGFEGRTKWINVNYKEKIILVVSSRENTARLKTNISIDYVFTMRKESK